jgi:sugar phosphate isomerase/epimerase
MPPVEHVLLAARTGCDFVSLGYGPVPWRLPRFPDWSLRDDQRLSTELRAVLADHRIDVELAEGFVVRPGVDLRSREADLDLFAELGARKVATVCMDPDANRCADQLTSLCELSAQRGLDVMYEFAPPHTFNTLEQVCEVIGAIGASNLALLIDSMHFFRCGEKPEELAGIDVRIGYLQLSDTPASQLDAADYYREACYNRLAPGAGELDLEALIRAVPSDLPIGLEVPMMARIDGGEALEDIVAQVVERSKALIARSRN